MALQKTPRPRFELRNVKVDGSEEQVKVSSIKDVLQHIGSMQTTRPEFLKFSALAVTASVMAACFPTSLVPSTGAPATNTPPENSSGKTEQPEITEIPTVDVAYSGAHCLGVQAHSGAITNLAVSRKGTLLASVGRDFLVKLWQIGDMSLLRTWGEENFSAISMRWPLAFSPDDQLLATVLQSPSQLGSKTGVLVWQVANGSPVMQLEYDYADFMIALDFHPNGQDLIIGGCNYIERRKISDGSLVWQTAIDRFYTNSLRFSSDGNSFTTVMAAYVNDKDDAIQRRNAQDGSLVDEFNPGMLGDVQAFDATGTLLAIAAGAGGGQYIQLWQLGDKRLLWSITLDSSDLGEAHNFSSLAFSPDGSLIAGGSDDGVVWLWKTQDGSLTRKLRGHPQGVDSLIFCSDPADLFVGDGKGTLHVWDANGLNDALDVCAFDPDATDPTAQALTYRLTDGNGVTRTYAAPCGAALPAGAVCTCNCIAGSHTVPEGGSGGGSGGGCSCVPVCVCMAV